MNLPPNDGKCECGAKSKTCNGGCVVSSSPKPLEKVGCDGSGTRCTYLGGKCDGMTGTHIHVGKKCKGCSSCCPKDSPREWEKELLKPEAHWEGCQVFRGNNECDCNHSEFIVAFIRQVEDRAEE